jgi:hypothetical protein
MLLLQAYSRIHINKQKDIYENLDYKSIVPDVAAKHELHTSLQIKLMQASFNLQNSWMLHWKRTTKTPEPFWQHWPPLAPAKQ